MRIDVLDLLWRLFSSRGLSVGLLSAILLAVALGAIFPQMPDDLSVESPEITQWRAVIRARYGQWTDPLDNLRLFSIRGSFWLKAPLALLAVNLVVCSAERLETALRWSRWASEDPARALPSTSQSHSLLLRGDRETASLRLHKVLRGLGYGVDVKESEGTTYVIGRRSGLTRWGTLLAHSGALLAVVGLVVGGRVAWREEGIALGPGQQYQVQHSESLSIRLDDFEGEPGSDDGAPPYAASVTVLDNGEDRSSGAVAPGVPLWYKGMSIYWLTQGPLIRLQATNAEGQPLSLQALTPSGQVMEEVVLQFSDEDNEGYVAVPERNLMLRLVLQSAQTDQAQQPPDFLWEAYRGGGTEVAFRETIRGSRSLEIDGDSYSARWGHYAVLGISHDPSVAPLAVGAVTLMIGGTCALFLRPRLVWVTVRGNESVVQLQTFTPGRENSGVEPREFENLVTQVKEAFGAP